MLRLSNVARCRITGSRATTIMLCRLSTMPVPLATCRTMLNNSLWIQMHSSDEDRLASTTNTHSRDGSYTNLTSAARQWERKYSKFNFKQSTWSLLLQRRSQWSR